MSRGCRESEAHSEGPASGELRPKIGPYMGVVLAAYFKVRLSSMGIASSQFSLR